MFIHILSDKTLIFISKYYSKCLICRDLYYSVLVLSLKGIVNVAILMKNSSVSVLVLSLKGIVN